MLWMELESIMLSEVSQSEKDIYRMISLICGNKKKKRERERKRPTKKQTFHSREHTDGSQRRGGG